MAQTEQNPEVKPDKVLAQALKMNMPSIRAVAGSLIDPDRLTRLALLCAEKNPFIYQCSWQSIARAVVQSSEVNLEVGSALNHAYLVPRKNGGVWEADLQISAFGFAELAYRSGMVKALWWYPVYKGDHFRHRLGLNPEIDHEPVGENEEDQNVTHVYAVAELMTGGKILHVLSRKQIDRLKDMNPAVKAGKFSPWSDNYAEMALAKVVKALCKRLPKSKELAKAMSFADAADTGDRKLADSDIINADFSENPRGTRADEVARKLGIDTDQYEGERVFDDEPEGLGL